MNSKLIIRIFTKETFDTRDMVIAIKNEFKQDTIMLINSNSVDIRIEKANKQTIESLRHFCKGFLWGRKNTSFTSFEE